MAEINLLDHVKPFILINRIQFGSSYCWTIAANGADEPDAENIVCVVHDLSHPQQVGMPFLEKPFVDKDGDLQYGHWLAGVLYIMSDGELFIIEQRPYNLIKCVDDFRRYGARYEITTSQAASELSEARPL